MKISDLFEAFEVEQNTRNGYRVKLLLVSLGAKGASIAVGIYLKDVPGELFHDVVYLGSNDKDDITMFSKAIKQEVEKLNLKVKSDRDNLTRIIKDMDVAFDIIIYHRSNGRSGLMDAYAELEKKDLEDYFDYFKL